jgi:adenylylsulfate reductase subunit A
MTISGATNWAAHNVDPLEKPMELMTSEPVFIGSHACSVGAWCCGSADVMPAEYKGDFPGVYTYMTTVAGLFTAGDGIGASAHKFSSGSHVTGRLAGKAACKFAVDNKGYTPNVSDATIAKLKEEVYQPMTLFDEKSKYTVTSDVSPYYLSPDKYMFRLQKIMGEYAGGWETTYGTSDKMLETCLWKLSFCGEDMEKLGAGNLHELLRAWEMKHRYWVAEACTRTRLARKESRWPGYYYKFDYLKLDEGQRHFVNVKYDVAKKEWTVLTKPMVAIL